MVNNAGIAIEARSPAPIHTTAEETWDTTMNVNAKSVFLGCKYAIAQFLAQLPLPSSDGSKGWIINVSSIYGLVGGGRNPSYSASKGAVANLTRQVALDYSEDGIHVNALCPGRECSVHIHACGVEDNADRLEDVQTAIFAETTQHMVSPEDMARMYPFKGPGRPEDIAKMAVVLASDDASWMTGACVSVDGGYVAR
jgi:NAD(P)-dependent dehydrogenase (short-subunit alcohol dehydrogenase family)